MDFRFRYLKDPDHFDLKQTRRSTLQKRRQDAIYEQLNAKLSDFLNRQRRAREEETQGGFRKTDLQGYHTTPDGVRGRGLNGSGLVLEFELTVCRCD